MSISFQSTSVVTNAFAGKRPESTVRERIPLRKENLPRKTLKTEFFGVRRRVDEIESENSDGIPDRLTTVDLPLKNRFPS